MPTNKQGERVEKEENLYRRIYRTPWHKYVNPDNTPTSRNFVPRKTDDGKLSVDIVSLTTKEEAVKDINKYALTEVSVADVESVGLFAIYDECTIERDGFNNPSHSLICGFEEDDDIKPALLARKAKVVFQ